MLQEANVPFFVNKLNILLLLVETSKVSLCLKKLELFLGEASCLPHVEGRNFSDYQI